MSNIVFPPYTSGLGGYDAHYALGLQDYRTPSKPKRSRMPLISSPHPDQFSPEYTTAFQQSVSRQFSHASSDFREGGDIAKDVQRALRAQERARMRKATLEGSPQSKRMLIPSPQSTTLRETPSLRHEMNGAPANLSIRAGSGDFQAHLTKNERVRMRSFKFPRLKDSISLPYLQNRRRNLPPSSSRRTSVIDDIPPPVPPLSLLGTTYFPSVATHGSPKHIAPLPRFDPFSRPRADSLTSLVEIRGDTGVNIPMRRSPATVRSSRLEQVPIVTNIFSNIDRQAASLGMQTCV